MTYGIDCVLGSGPAAVACAHALIDKGRRVVLIDPARKLDTERAALIDRFRERPNPENFVASMRALRSRLPKDVQAKRLPFSSPHAYADIDRLLPVNAKNATIARSLAAGGLSAMWGATVMPLSARSFRNWPVTLQEMEPFYRRMAEIIDIPTVQDDLEALYANFGKAAPNALSEQGAQLMSNLLNNRSRLREKGIIFGRCRSAVGNMYATNSEGCNYSGLCMVGCPYRAVFSAEYALERLKTKSGFEHRANYIGEHFEETPLGVKVRLRHLDNNQAETLECERLFVACGASTSLRLVASAMKWFDDTFYLLDTQLVSIPAILRDGTCQAAVPRALSFGQVLVEIDDPSICDELIHLQIYGFNPFIADVIRARYGALYPGDRLMQPLYRRMMVVMGYLPGQVSARVALRVRPSNGQAGLPIADFIGEANPRTKPVAQSVGRKLQSLRREFGWYPLTPMMDIAKPGDSNHLACGLPMREKPGPRESDQLGRPGGLQRVHVVDGACFSDLPGEHLTYTIMANAARIATQSTEGRT